MPKPSLRVLRRPAVEERTGLSAPSLYRLARAGRFPRPIKIGAMASGWIEDEVEAWLAERIAERDRSTCPV